VVAHTKLFRLQKANYAVVISLVCATCATKLKLKLTATTFTKIASPQTNCNMKKRHYAYTKRTRDVAKKATFHYQGKLQERFLSGLNEMKLVTTT